MSTFSLGPHTLSQMSLSSKKRLILTNGTLLERKMNKASDDTRFRHNDKVTPKIQSPTYKNLAELL